MEEEYESRFTLPQMLAVEQKIQRKQHTVRVASDMLDLFFPKIIKTVINMLGGEDDDNGRKAPSSFKILSKQRNRWTRGTAETLWIHKKLIFNPRYHFLGIISMPFWFLF